MNKNHRKSFTLLLVDDDPALLAFLIELCGDLKLSIQTANNGAQAMQAVNSGCIHIALVDLRLPDLSGIEVLEVVQAAYPRSLRWLMTGFADFEAATKAVNRAGIHQILLKPLDPRHYRAILKQGMEQLEVELDREQLQTKLIEVNKRLKTALKRRTQDARRFQEELYRTREELERTFWELVGYSRYSSLGLAIGVLAHDIRNPLTVLSGQLQLLAAQEQDDPSFVCRVASMKRQVGRIQDLVEGFSKLAAGRVDEEREFAVLEAVKDALMLVQRLFAAKGLQAILTPEDAVIRVKGHQGHWVHVLFKLMEYIAQRAGDSRVEIEIGEDEDQARVAIRFAMREADSPDSTAVFQPYLEGDIGESESVIKADPDSTVFYLCARILEQYGGHLEVSQQDKERVFVIFYPRLEKSAAPDLRPAESLEQEG